MRRTDGGQLDEWADRVLKAVFRGQTRSEPHVVVTQVLKEVQASMKAALLEEMTLEAGNMHIIDQLIEEVKRTSFPADPHDPALKHFWHERCLRAVAEAAYEAGEIGALKDHDDLIQRELARKLLRERDAMGGPAAVANIMVVAKLREIAEEGE